MKRIPTLQTVARAVAFRKLARLFSDFIMAVPLVDMTQEEEARASQLLKEKFSEIMEEYDRNK
jgi:hypothetical protein